MSDGGDPESQVRTRFDGGGLELTPRPQARNKAIDAGIERERQRLKNQVKLLILGTGESGKSTGTCAHAGQEKEKADDSQVMKQMVSRRDISLPAYAFLSADPSRR